MLCCHRDDHHPKDEGVRIRRTLSEARFHAMTIKKRGREKGGLNFDEARKKTKKKKKLNTSASKVNFGAVCVFEISSSSKFAVPFIISFKCTILIVILIVIVVVLAVIVVEDERRLDEVELSELESGLDGLAVEPVHLGRRVLAEVVAPTIGVAQIGVGVLQVTAA